VIGAGTSSVFAWVIDAVGRVKWVGLYRWMHRRTASIFNFAVFDDKNIESII
jgi:hypothetical protein